jgi:hypothetical protein
MRRTILETLKQAVDSEEQFILRSHPHIRTIIQTHITIAGTFSDGRDTTYSDPTFIQYAALMNKPKSLELFLELASDQDHLVPFRDIFLPPGSNIRSNLLVLAVHSPDNRTDALRVLLTWMRQHPEWVSPVTVDGDSPNQPTALFEAVELGHTAAVELLMEAEADPLRSSAGLPCPLLAAALVDAGIFDMMWAVAGAPTRERLLATKWNEESLAVDETGGGVTLDKILVRRGLDEMAEKVRRMFAEAKQRELLPVVHSIIEPCQAAGCDEVESLIKCDTCGKWFCPEHHDGHGPECDAQMPDLESTTDLG